jgi:hypothetical protein
MDEKLKATISRRLEKLPDDTARQLLDYIEFLESKYNRSTRERSPLERLAENVEGTLRASRIGGAAIKGTAQVLDAASSMVRGVADAGRVVVEELQRLDVSDQAKDEKVQRDDAEAELPEGTEYRSEGEPAHDDAQPSAKDANSEARADESTTDKKET